MQTLTWLQCDKDRDDRGLVSLLWCSACREFQDRICSLKNYSATWANGSANQRTSNVLDHAGLDAHKAVMSRLRTAKARARNEDITTYAPIARSMLTLQEAEQDRIRNKFDLCYFLAKEGLAFKKFPALCDLEVKHKVDLGHSYRTPPSARQFTHYIAQAQREEFLEKLGLSRFYSSPCRED